jgi:sarcosine oxidase, subunit gamma
MADREVDRPSIVASVSPLAGLALPVSDGLVQVREAPASGRLVLRAGPDSARRLASAMGTALEGRINRAVTWLLLADAEGDPWLAARLAEAGRGVPMAVVDVTHRSAGVLIEGTGVEDVLAAGCPLPLDGMGFPVGRATRTVIGKAEVVLWRQSEDRFRVEVATSFAAYLIAYLGAAIADEAMIRRARLQPGQ